MYENIDCVLSNYLSCRISGSVSEADAALRRRIEQSAEFSMALRSELQRALSDDEYSWLRAFEMVGVASLKDESDARAYAKARLWDPYFQDQIEIGSAIPGRRGELPDLLRRVLKSFCHVEWYEVDELAELIKSGKAEFDVPLLKQQLDRVVDSGDLPLGEVARITGEEFDSLEDGIAWLKEVRDKLFEP